MTTATTVGPVSMLLIVRVPLSAGCVAIEHQNHRSNWFVSKSA